MLNEANQTAQEWQKQKSETPLVMFRSSAFACSAYGYCPPFAPLRLNLRESTTCKFFFISGVTV
jgi:hypothetical protein